MALPFVGPTKSINEKLDPLGAAVTEHDKTKLDPLGLFKAPKIPGPPPPPQAFQMPDSYDKLRAARSSTYGSGTVLTGPNGVSGMGNTGDSTLLGG